jgi:hypothetical protein
MSYELHGNENVARFPIVLPPVFIGILPHFTNENLSNNDLGRKIKILVGAVVCCGTQFKVYICVVCRCGLLGSICGVK